MLWVNRLLYRYYNEDCRFEHGSKGSISRYLAPPMDGRYVMLLRHCFIGREERALKLESLLYRMGKWPQILQAKLTFYDYILGEVMEKFQGKNKVRRKRLWIKRISTSESKNTKSLPNHVKCQISCYRRFQLNCRGRYCCKEVYNEILAFTVLHHLYIVRKSFISKYHSLPSLLFQNNVKLTSEFQFSCYQNLPFVCVCK